MVQWYNGTHAKSSENFEPVVEAMRVDETVKMEKLELPSKEWLLSELSTVPEVRPHPTWVRQSSGFWKRVSRLWQFFKK